jgi:hypothetical protein
MGLHSDVAAVTNRMTPAKLSLATFGCRKQLELSLLLLLCLVVLQQLQREGRILDVR